MTDFREEADRSFLETIKMDGVIAVFHHNTNEDKFTSIRFDVSDVKRDIESALRAAYERGLEDAAKVADRFSECSVLSNPSSGIASEIRSLKGGGK